MDLKTALFISQEITPYLPETVQSILGRDVPQSLQDNGVEVRTFMPKYSVINERRNQLHEVIRLSGLNIVIDDTDHPLIIKVATMQHSRMQVYFIDNDDYFMGQKKGILETDAYPEDNDERTMFFTRGVIETVRKLRWVPSMVHCSGWITALTPLYIRRRYADDPVLAQSKIVYSLFGFDVPRQFDSRMLEKLAGQGHLYATDVDSAEIVKTTARLAQKGYGPEIFTPKNMNFADIDQVAPDQKFDFVLADLGVSSMQIDNPERGFSFKTDAPLDLRLNQASGKTAAERLLELTERELIDILVINSDEPYAEKIAKQMMIKLWRGEYIQTTKQLYATIEKALEFLPKREQKEAVKKSCQRVFQALRIDVNCEFEVLESFLEKLPYCMNEGGRVAILTFHSGEDRMVKKAFKQFKNLGIFSQISDEVIRPAPEECFKNPRAHSTKLRWAIRSDI